MIPVGYIGAGIAAAIAGTLVYANLPIRFLIPMQRASVKYLADTQLSSLDNKQTFKAEDLWKDAGAVVMVIRRPGCQLCREEAAALSSLKPKLNAAGVPLIGIVHERRGVPEFQKFFDGDIFLDKERRFYGPNERWMGYIGFLRVSVWQNIFRSKRAGFTGNLEGEGRLLGGVFVIGAGDRGILLEHRESEWGDHANISSVENVLAKMK